MFYRSASPRFARSADLITGEGARKAGGRWNPPGSFAAVYGSLAVHVAAKEAIAQCVRFGIPAASVLPMVIAAVEARLSLVLDLTQPTVLRALRESLVRMRREKWPWAQERGKEALTQAIGRAAFEEGLEALLVPSAAIDDAVNIVVFPARLGADSFLRTRGLDLGEGPRCE